MSGAKKLFLKQFALKQTDISLPHSCAHYRVMSVFVRRNPHQKNTLSYRETPLTVCSLCTTCFGRSGKLSRRFNMFYMFICLCHWLHTYLNWMIVLPALPDAVQNRMKHCNTRNMVKYVLQSTGHDPSTAHPVPSGPIQLQLPYICKARKCSSYQFCPSQCQWPNCDSKGRSQFLAVRISNHSTIARRCHWTPVVLDTVYTWTVWHNLHCIKYMFKR